MRATVVLPVPGAPVKIRWWLTAPTDRPALRRHSLTWISSISARTSPFTPARPIIESSSPSSRSTRSSSCWVAPSIALMPTRLACTPSPASITVTVAPSSMTVPGEATFSIRHPSIDPRQPRSKRMPTPCVSCTQHDRIDGALCDATAMPASPVRVTSQRSSVGFAAW
jgi:hypothetical protein